MTFDIWHDDEGVWAEVDGKLLGPFDTEGDAEDDAQREAAR